MTKETSAKATLLSSGTMLITIGYPMILSNKLKEGLTTIVVGLSLVFASQLIDNYRKR